MSEHRKDSPHGHKPYGEREQRDLLGNTLPGGGKKSSAQRTSGLFDEVKTPIIRTSQAEPKTVLPSDIKDYFRGRDLPDSVFVPSGVSYYKKFEDIPTEGFRNRSRSPKIDSIENRASVVLTIAPPTKDEDETASFKFAGERGLYVRVIKGYEEETHNGLVTKTPIVRWVPFNSDEAVLAGKIRRV